jgi:hypothetical protein
MDGRFLADCFAEPAEPRRHGSSYRNAPVDPARASVYKEGEEAEITERLRALGYIE